MTTFSPPQSELESPLLPRQTLPTMYDLPSENPEEVYLPDQYHGNQPGILEDTFIPSNYDLDQVFVAADLNLYYDVQHTNWYKRPDWFAAVGVPRLYAGYDLRLSYVIWQEQVSPFIVVELLSPSTENEDLGRTVRKQGEPPTKWEVYEQILRIPYYIIFSRFTNEVQAFHLVGSQYEPMTAIDGRFPMPELGLSFAVWEGTYRGCDRLWLRFFKIDGEMIFTPAEQAVLAQQEKMLAQQEKMLAQREKMLAQQETMAAQQETMAAQQETMAAQQETMLAQQEKMLAQQEKTAAQEEMMLAQQETMLAQERARLAEERAERLAAKLRELNINLEDLS